MKILQRMITGMLLLGSFSQAGAGLDETRSSLWLAFSLMDFDYEEFLPGGMTANREDGTLPGISAGVALSRERVFAGSRLGFWSGRADYRGPEDSRTDEDIVDWQASAGLRLYRDARVEAGVYTGGGYRRWERDIRSTPTAAGLFEIYDWWYLMLGVRGAYIINADSLIRADVGLTRPLNPEVEVEFETGFDDQRLELGERTGARVALTYEKRLDASTTLRIVPWFEYWELGKSRTVPLTSNGVVVGTVFEPRSETRNAGIDIGLSWP